MSFIDLPLSIFYQVAGMGDQLQHHYASFNVSFLLWLSSQGIGTDGVTRP